MAAASDQTKPLTPRQQRLAKNKRRHGKEVEQRQLLQQLPEPMRAPAADAVAGPSLDCPHFAACSGCTLDTSLDTPPLLHEARTFFTSDCGLLDPFRLHVGSIGGWRQRARLAVRPGSEGQPVIGLFKEGTHTATAIPSCVVHHPAINEAVRVLQAAVDECGVAPYDEVQHTGQLRYVQLTVVQPEAQQQGQDAAAGQPTGAATVQLVLVWNGEQGGAVDGSLATLADRLWRADQRRPDGSALLHSVWANFQPEPTNTILGEGWRLLHGAEVAWARLGGADVCFGPGSFMQANFGAMDACLSAMQRHVPLGSIVVDLHAGVGTIGLSLAATRQPRAVRFVEINGQGQPPFQRSAASLRRRLAPESGGEGGGDGGAAPPELEYHVAAAGSDPRRWCQGADVVVCDPPRKGLEPALLRWLSGPGARAAGVRRLLYLSCGFPALRRDTSRLLASGQWRLHSAEGFLFFPGADHVETLAVFDALP